MVEVQNVQDSISLYTSPLMFRCGNLTLNPTKIIGWNHGPLVRAVNPGILL